MKEIILHVGMPKTGTTSIQDTLSIEKNKRVLEENGYAYLSNLCENDIHRLYNLFCNKSLSDVGAIQSGYSSKEEIDTFHGNVIEELIAEFKAISLHRILISCELLCFLQENDLIELRNFFLENFEDVSFRILLSVRNPIDYVTSNIQQEIAWPSSGKTPSEIYISYIKEVNDYYRFAIQKFIDIFGMKYVEVFSFENMLEQEGGLVEYFLKIFLGLPKKDISRLTICKSNESSCGEVIELLSYINERVPFLLKDSLGNWSLSPLRSVGDLSAFFGIKGTKFDLSYEQKLEIKARLKDDIQWLKNTTGIDYTNISFEKRKIFLEYNRDTIDSLINVFPKLSIFLKKLFLNFFEQKYSETGDEKFKVLFAKDSSVYKDFIFAEDFESALAENNSDADRYNKLINIARQPDQLQIMPDYGNGFCSWQDGFTFLTEHKNQVQVEITFNDFENVTRLKIDPSHYSAIVLVKEVSINSGKTRYKISSGNYFSKYGNAYYFFKEDPHFILVADDVITSVRLELYFDRGSYPFFIHSKIFDNQMDKLVYGSKKITESNISMQIEIDRENVEINELQLVPQRTKEEKSYEISRAKHIVGGLEEEVALYNSRSWRFTGYFRKVSQISRKIYKSIKKLDS